MRKVARSVLLIVAALGAVLLSGTATFELFYSEFGFWRAFAAVLMLEAGIPGIIFSLQDPKEDDPKFLRIVSGLVIALMNFLSSTVALAINLGVIIVSNVLFNIDKLQVVMSEQLFVMLQVAVFSIATPLLAVGYFHRLLGIISEKSTKTLQEPEKDGSIKVYTKQDRIDYIREHYPDINKPELAVKFGVSAGTISRDVREVQEKGFDKF